jgi:hypothetical protein
MKITATPISLIMFSNQNINKRNENNPVSKRLELYKAKNTMKRTHYAYLIIHLHNQSQTPKHNKSSKLKHTYTQPKGTRETKIFTTNKNKNSKMTPQQNSTLSFTS